jgi:hypothetical protein
MPSLAAAAAAAAAAVQAANWLAKLGVVKKELVDEADRARPDVPELAAGYVYLQVCWITIQTDDGVWRGSCLLG